MSSRQSNMWQFSIKGTLVKDKKDPYSLWSKKSIDVWEKRALKEVTRFAWTFERDDKVTGLLSLRKAKTWKTILKSIVFPEGFVFASELSYEDDSFQCTAFRIATQNDFDEKWADAEYNKNRKIGKPTERLGSADRGVKGIGTLRCSICKGTYDPKVETIKCAVPSCR